MRNHKKFYRLLKIMSDASGLPADELREQLVEQFTDGRTKSLTQTEATEYSLMIGAMEAQATEKPDEANADLWRKRVMGSIGGWLRLKAEAGEIDDEAAVIKAIACRAAGCTDFNKIPLSKLRAVYYEFLEKQKIAKRTETIKKK